MSRRARANDEAVAEAIRDCVLRLLRASAAAADEAHALLGLLREVRSRVDAATTLTRMMTPDPPDVCDDNP